MHKSNFQNIATWLNSWISLRLRSEESLQFFYHWLTENYVIGDALLFLITFFYYYQNTCTMLLSFDRFAVIYSITSNTKWWQKLYGIVTMSALGVCALLNILLLLDFCFAKKALIHDADYSTGLNKITMNNRRLVAITQLVFGVLAFHMFSVRRLMALRRTMNVAKEVSYFLITFCIFITQALNLVVVITYTIAVFVVYENSGPNQFQEDLRAVMYFISDLFSSGPALYILCLPGPIRRYVSYKAKKTIDKFIAPSWTSDVHPE
ncbi:hypothetical protein PRIPAC_73765 [Pristionchus pacificus]|uniref:Serpentine receptor class gamma n=1 Tax=Pristionchus pacificus TaxID=54126 RepID=A0A2A6C055_PRIPA|nr:hypothetical protein PRIPAC_73765 [Pristionchus pacificus]|eukprot:PDM71467.1 G protein-coupled receptor [Pristionchus pacificus]